MSSSTKSVQRSVEESIISSLSENFDDFPQEVKKLRKKVMKGYKESISDKKERKAVFASALQSLEKVIHRPISNLY